MESHHKCPNCGRKSEENEIYCYFCEFELAELGKKVPGAKNKKFPGKKQE